MKGRLVFGLVGLAVLLATAVLFGIVAGTGRADPQLSPVPPHRHWINGEQVGPDICDNLGDPGIQRAFDQFHNNLHVATGSSIGRAAPGLHDGRGGEIAPTPCSATSPPA